MLEEQIYNLLAYLVVIVAAYIAIKKMWVKAFGKKVESSCSDGCGGCTTSCDLKELVKQKN